MLPLVQRHHSVPYQSSHIDSFSPKQNHLAYHVRPRYDEPRYGRPGASFSHRAFPIRASQPPPPPQRASGPSHPRSNSFIPPPHLADHGAEHQLRRKTPNGTIDAGYDGTPTQLASGPPPLKHMILPRSSHGMQGPIGAVGPQNDYSIPPHHVGPSTPDLWFYHSNTSGFSKPEHDGLSNLNSGTFPFDRGRHSSFDAGGLQPSVGALDYNCFPTPYPPYNNGVRIPTALQPMYHQSPGPAVFNNGGLIPPPAWPESNLSTYYPLVHQGAYPYPGVHQQPSFPFHPMDGLPASGFVYPAAEQYEVGGHNFQAPSHGLESLSLDPSHRPFTNGVHVHDTSSPTMFREKALLNAQKAYFELLANAHSNKKSHHSHSGTNTKALSRMTILPKLPKHAKSQFARRSSRGLLASALSVEDSLRPKLVKNGFPGGEMNPPFYTLFGGAEQNHAARNHPMPTPEANAQAAVEMLHSLCDQSGWKWIDGILLGGCIHYGLGDYEKALKWFESVVMLDERHVEAISNIAASHYCLDRLDDAEAHWKKAVKIRPSYLEAVEHLVGLLCATNKGRQAVEVISLVQQSIRLTENHDSSTWHPGTGDGQRGSERWASNAKDPDDHADGTSSLGFGSSGYAVPGSENGRIIALIHAKGNLLYALKDIDRASRSFEEAVLISAGRKLTGIQALIQRIQSVLSPQTTQVVVGGSVVQVPYSGPLLLPPERARHTAQLVFAGELPGLYYVTDKISRTSAISTTSNSLLSLAKIFQDAMSNGASLPRLLPQSSGVGDILALYYLSLSLSQSPSTANNVGILLASIQHSSPTHQTQAMSSASTPQIYGIAPGSGLALALAYYNYGLTLDPKHVHLHTNLGSLLKDIGQLDLAIQMYEQAVACDDKFDIALTNLANAVKDRGRTNEAIGYYKRAVLSNPDFAEAVCGLSTALNSVCDWRGRGGVLLRNGQYDRWHVDDQGMVQDVQIQKKSSGLVKRVVGIVSKQLTDASHWGIGTLQSNIILMLSQQLAASLTTWRSHPINLNQELQKWAGRPWEGSRFLRLVERSIKVAMQRWYQDKYVHKRVSSAGYRRAKLPSSLVVPAAPTVLPFHTFTCPLSAKEIRMISQRNAARISCSTLRSPWLPDTVFEPPPPPKSHLNIGYVSSDFNNHPLAHLMQSVFGFHDSTRAKAFCYATTSSDRSIHRQQIEQEAPVFRDVTSWSAEKLVNQIVKDEIHILVNLNGYTRGARNEIFAARPAPIQMSFMGFAGTLGAEWCDYILADETAIPQSTLRPTRSNLSLEDVFSDEEHSEAEDWMYSENIIFCRDSFFCCDHAQSCDADERSVTWEDEQHRRWKMRKQLFPDLPDGTIIMGNFNQLYKIDPSTFRTWLRILSNVPKAILWLLRFPELGEANLKRTAREWASDDVASRIYFTDVAPKQQHISRARVCDLFLDTPECNAHTTAADVLWSSTPLLTLPRYPYKMCSRMAASILRGALPKNAEGNQAADELIAADDDDYETLATRLAGGLTYRPTDKGFCEGRGRLADMRKILFDAKWTCGLFNTRRWVSDLEDAYDEAWRRWVAGESGDIHL